jgi:hypothetical protein
MNVHILDPAKDDLADGYRFYEIQSSGLGTYFLDTIFAGIDSLETYAGIHPMYDPPYFQMLSIAKDYRSRYRAYYRNGIDPKIFADRGAYSDYFAGHANVKGGY